MTNGKIELAREVATKAHEGQFRSDGKPYITHPEAVAKIVEDIYHIYMVSESDKEDAIQAALLHDVIEDSSITEAMLKDLGFSDTVIMVVKTCSRGLDENYFDFIKRISYISRISVLVKIADLTHNLSDLKEGSLKDKYRFALDYLQNEILY